MKLGIRGLGWDWKSKGCDGIGNQWDGMGLGISGMG